MITQLMSAPHISWHWTLLSWITQLLYQTTITPVFYTKAEYLLKFYMYMDVQYLGRPTDLLYSKCMYNIINRLLGACNECCLHHKMGKSTHSIINYWYWRIRFVYYCISGKSAWSFLVVPPIPPDVPVLSKYTNTLYTYPSILLKT